MVSSDTTTVPDEWKPVRLGDVAEIRSGSGFPLSRQGRRSGQYPFIKVSDMTLDGNEVYINYANNFVDEKDVEELKATIFPPGTIVFPKVGAAISTNKKRLLNMPTIIDNNIAGVTIKDSGRCDTRFLHAWFESIDLTKLANVSAVPSITSSRLKREWISLPPIAEQNSIATVLDSIGEAIESTETTITNTESLCDTLLHELLTRGVPGWHSEWKNIPAIGTIPSGWKVCDFKDIAEVSFSPVDKKSVVGEIPVQLCNYTDVFYNSYIHSGMNFMTATAKSNECEKWRLREGDVLFTKDSETPHEIGIPAYVMEDMPGVLCGYHLGLARPKAGLIMGNFLANALTSIKLKKQLVCIANGVTRFGLTLQAVCSLKIPLPPIKEQHIITSILDSFREIIEHTIEQRDALIALKLATSDSLLTGRVRLRYHGG